MRIRRAIDTVLIVGTTTLLSCGGSRVPSPAMPGVVGPPPAMMSPEAGLPVTLDPIGRQTSADSLAARARRDLLESMALGSAPAGVPWPTSGESGESGPVVTWTMPATEQFAGPPESYETSAFAAAESASTNSPNPDTGPDPDRDVATLTAALARALYERSQQSGVPLKDLTLLAALSIIDGERTLVPEAIEFLSKDEQAALMAMQQWFLALENSLDDREAVIANLVEATRGLAASLRREPRFGTTGSRLATSVGGFGDVIEWDQRSESEIYNFIAHSGQEFILYLELVGFQSELDEAGQWKTATSQELTIYADRDGIPIWREAWQTAVDHAGTRRRDYFTVQKVRLPANLSVGKYQLKVRIRDEQTLAETETTIPFVMTAAVMTP